MPFAADKLHAWLRPPHNHIARTSLQPGEEAAETICCKHSIDVSKYFQFFPILL